MLPLLSGGTEIVPAMEKDEELAAAVQIVGVHSFMPSVGDATGARVTALSKAYWDSENNMIDGPMWPDAKHDTAVAWISNLLENYLYQNITGGVTAVCILLGCAARLLRTVSACVSVAHVYYELCRVGRNHRMPAVPRLDSGMLGRSCEDVHVL
eukprot:COSAG01_NODE_4660_length_4842_cov_22.777567_2_plen_154_part_00